MQFDVKPVGKELEPALREKIDQKTKPLGALGLVEELALRVGLMQGSLTPRLSQPTVVVFAGDHGVAQEGVSAYPSEVTAQMVLNFLGGGAAVSVFARQNGLDLRVVDAGCAARFQPDRRLVDAKIAAGTKNFVRQAAMSQAQCRRALEGGGAVVAQLHRQGCNVVGFGEMGIGNTSSAALLMSCFCRLPLRDCVGAGTGLDEAGVGRKLEVLEQARRRVARELRAEDGRAVEDLDRDPLRVLREFAGFEIVMMCGAMLRAAELGMVVLVDGFIATAALLAARRLDPHVTDYCLFAHRSDETGHAAMLDHLQARPLLDLGMRLGEGTGAALAYPLVAAAVRFLNEMASFASAQVSGKL